MSLDVPLSIHARWGASVAGDALFDYRYKGAAFPGQRAIVPWGRQRLIGLVVETADESVVDEGRLRNAYAVLDDIAPLEPHWFDLMRFAARYYQRSLGEVAVPALPALLRKASGYLPVAEGTPPRSRSLAGLQKKLQKFQDRNPSPGKNRITAHPEALGLGAEQRLAIDTILEGLTGEESQTRLPYLLHGITGSGKTEVYLHVVAAALELGRQVLVLVPEINLTPQLERVFRSRFPHASLAMLHSAMSDGERAVHWLASHAGVADILLGTRMAVLASLPNLGLIVVDEEHDPSFKQQEGLRYSARDLAVMRARQQEVPIILGSATPALESWLQAERGRYQRVTLTTRAVHQASLPQVELVDVRREPLTHGFSQTLKDALQDRLDRSEQSLIFLNRRGYAPVLCCGACGWISDCRRCSAHMVYHKSDGHLHCHHCGWECLVPRGCPVCGNLDLAPLGRGTQRIEETLREWYPGSRVARIDRDSTRTKGSAETMFADVHGGNVDILIGTQMVAKGHDFQNLTLVGIVDADSALFSHDFRAPERLFSNLMQVAGRAGRSDKSGKVFIQTRFPEHPLFAALRNHDYTSFANAQLAERQAANLPPYSHQAMLRAEARSLGQAIEFLNHARSLAERSAGPWRIALYDPVPMPLVRLANLERAQLLIESTARSALQAFLPAWMAELQSIKTPVSWHLEVDPFEI
ncbi:MAG: primosomal protein N' [Burkholderiaceae bacterium]